MNKKDDLFEKFRSMSKEELIQYHVAALAASRFIDAIGIGLILFIMIFTSVITISLGAVFLYIFANIGANLGETIAYIEQRILRYTDK